MYILFIYSRYCIILLNQPTSQPSGGGQYTSLTGNMGVSHMSGCLVIVSNRETNTGYILLFGLLLTEIMIRMTFFRSTPKRAAGMQRTSRDTFSIRSHSNVSLRILCSSLSYQNIVVILVHDG